MILSGHRMLLRKEVFNTIQFLFCLWRFTFYFWCRQVGVEDLFAQLFEVSRNERRVTSVHLVKDDAKRPQIALNRMFLTLQHFRCQITWIAWNAIQIPVFQIFTANNSECIMNCYKTLDAPIVLYFDGTSSLFDRPLLSSHCSPET